MGKSKIDWSEQEKKVLKKFYPLLGNKVTKDDLIQLFPCRTWQSIQTQASNMGIKCSAGKVDMDFMKRLEKAVRSI